MPAYSTEQYNALTAAIAQGVTRVKYGDKEVEYRSLNEMLRTKELMEAELGIKKARRTTFAQHSKGLK